MATKQHTIELNGKRYDTRTGKVLSANEVIQSGGQTYTKPVKQSGVALDGFARQRVNHAERPKTAAYAVHKKTEKSKTLMRHAVQKPRIKPELASPIRKHEVPRTNIDPVRKSRAQKVRKSNLVQRFAAPRADIKPTTAALSVQPEPAHAPPLTLLNKHQEVFSANQKALHQAVANASSHTEARAKKTTQRQRIAHKLKLSNRTVTLATASLSVLLLVGFVAYQNVPNLAIRLATTRAGVEGSLPSYQPAGFGVSGPIHYKQGEITISYKSHTDNRGFQVSQRNSQWNSETLLENHVASGQRAFQTYQDNGKTIYIYDDNATWVDGGVWYEIEGNSSLNSDQLLRMASSM